MRQDMQDIWGWSRIGKPARKFKETWSGLLDAEGQFTGIGIVEQHPGSLVEHVRIDAVSPQERNAALPGAPFGFEAGEFAAQLRNLLVEILLRPQPAIAGIGIDAEIADYQRCYGICLLYTSPSPRD